LKIAEVLSAQPHRLWHLAKQAGVTHAVGRAPISGGTMTADFMELLHLKKNYEDFGFELAALEPGLEMMLPKTKLGLEGRDEEISMVQTLIRNMGELGIPVLCYNFMAHFNWVRTSVALPERGGALVTGYDHALLKNAPLTEVGTVSEDRLWESLKYFLKQVVPVAEKAGVRLSLHPDDPPISPIRGISRIITSAQAIQEALDLVPSEYSGVTLCQGTLAAAGEDVPSTIRRFGRQGKIFYVHFRDIRGTAEKFVETFHDNGQTDMFEAVKAYVDSGFVGVARVDHVPTMEGERNDTPGYETVGRMFAIGYLKGLLEGARRVPQKQTQRERVGEVKA